MSEQSEFQNVELSVRRNYTGDLLEVGIVLDGAFFAVAALKAAEVDAARKEAKAEQADRDAQAASDRRAQEQADRDAQAAREQQTPPPEQTQQ